MNPPWQPPEPKRFRPNEPPNSDRQWINGPPPHGHHPHVHPSRAAQLPPPPPIAPYHQQHGPPPPNPAPYYPSRATQQLPPPPHHHYPPSHPPNTQQPPSRSRSNNKSSDPRSHSHNRQQPPINTPQPHWNHHQMPPPMPMPHNIRAVPSSHSHSQTSNNNNSEQILDVLHIGADENKNFNSFAVTLNQIYGSRNIDGLPFGSTRSTAIQFDGRIRSSPILSFLPQAIDTPSKKVRVYELAPLAAADKRSYDELVAFFTKNERCPVVDKEYTMGVLLYFVPPKLIFKKVDPTITNDPRLKKQNQKLRGRKHGKKGKDEQSGVKTNFVELLKLGGNGQMMKEDRVWMISITSTSKYLMYKQKQKDKEIEKENLKRDKRKNKRKKQISAAEDLSDIEISSDDDDLSDSDSSQESQDTDDDGLSDDERQRKGDDIIKSELIIALESLYKHIGQRLPDVMY